MVKRRRLFQDFYPRAITILTNHRISEQERAAIEAERDARAAEVRREIVRQQMSKQGKEHARKDIPTPAQLAAHRSRHVREKKTKYGWGKAAEREFRISKRIRLRIMASEPFRFD